MFRIERRNYRHVNHNPYALPSVTLRGHEMRDDRGRIVSCEGPSTKFFCSWHSLIGPHRRDEQGDTLTAVGIAIDQGEGKANIPYREANEVESRFRLWISGVHVDGESPQLGAVFGKACKATESGSGGGAGCIQPIQARAPRHFHNLQLRELGQ